eukprot:TRINITY_DN5059_c2_g1_i1.p1 TRINITY_DN5059_c2_g1~~TRINITY_DN5059_c2_g1_i1.p1  ORF type:complete len:222 (-),score=59.51 TRINITY_DN5059_c2_g1_i1:78-644(-)
MATVTECTLVVLGANGVGKSALITEFISHVFVESDPTVEDYYRKQVYIDDEACTLNIFDTSYTHLEHSPLRDEATRAAQGFVYVFSVTSRSSFDEIASFREYVERTKDGEEHKWPIVLLGNKCDLEGQREVAATEGREMATDLSCLFFETSAKERINVEEAFYDLVREVRKDAKGEKVRGKERNCVLL